MPVHEIRVYTVQTTHLLRGPRKGAFSFGKVAKVTVADGRISSRRRCFWFCLLLRQDHLQDSLLGVSFRWRDGLCVNVHCDFAVSVPQNHLNSFRIFTVRLQDGRFQLVLVLAGYAFSRHSQARTVACRQRKGVQQLRQLRLGIRRTMYQLTDKGVALEITAKSTKYYKDDDLN
jgi:hypothetical protein